VLTVYLSVSANYEIRRMLKEHVDSVSVIQSRALSVSESVNLNVLLRKLYPRRFEIASKVRNLELLAEIYRQVTGQVSGNRSSLRMARSEVKRRIFQILGIRFGVSEVKLPPVVLEREVRLFPFFGEGEMREAMTHEHKFYGKIVQATVGDCSKLYQLGIVLAEQGLPCVITTSPEFYSLWVGLRSPVYAVFLKDGIGAMRRALALHSVLCRFKQAKFAIY
jgi:hypothetical protein